MDSQRQDHLLNYFIRELAYLRRSGASFAREYPKIAARLELGETECPDPHVERLIEAFAFLTGRIQYNIDSEFSLFTSALLEVLYPHYLTPIPSMSIAQFEPDPEQGDLSSGYLIPAHTPLFTRTPQGETCRFRTTYPVTLWPLEITFAGFEPTNRYAFLDTQPEVATVLRLRLNCAGGSDLHELPLETLRFHLHGLWNEVGPLYELLFCRVLRLALLREHQTRPVLLTVDHLLPVGFDQAVIPQPLHAHPAYRLLQEYFAFPDKFLFFDINGLEHLNPDPGDRYFDLLFFLDQRPREGLRISEENFRLGCTPIINLFRQISEPIRLNYRQTEYRLVPDMRREYATEIHSIRKVTASSDEADETIQVQPFFSFRHNMEGREPRAFWTTRRVPAERADLPGTELFISFMDLEFDPRLPATQTLFAHTLCTNRHLASQVPAQAELQIEEVAPLNRIFCLNKPTPQLDPPLQGATIWRIISHLSLNYLSFSAGEGSLEALRELLRLYQFVAPHKPLDRQVAGLRQMEARRVVKRLGRDAWRGFVRGHEITLEFDNNFYVGGSAFLLASVLNHFFPLYTTTNSFTQLVIKSSQREGVWKKWPPRTGHKELL